MTKLTQDLRKFLYHWWETQFNGTDEENKAKQEISAQILIRCAEECIWLKK